MVYWNPHSCGGTFGGMYSFCNLNNLIKSFCYAFISNPVGAILTSLNVSWSLLNPPPHGSSKGAIATHQKFWREASHIPNFYVIPSQDFDSDLTNHTRRIFKLRIQFESSRVRNHSWSWRAYPFESCARGVDSDGWRDLTGTNRNQRLVWGGIRTQQTNNITARLP